MCLISTILQHLYFVLSSLSQRNIIDALTFSLMLEQILMLDFMSLEYLRFIVLLELMLLNRSKNYLKRVPYQTMCNYLVKPPFTPQQRWVMKNAQDC